jgi:16S rRNA G966 N2-methylase RsmD
MKTSNLSPEVAALQQCYLPASMSDWKIFWAWFELPENHDLSVIEKYRQCFEKDRDFAQSKKRQKKRHGTTHFGGKGQESVYKTIINQMPPHKVYKELFGGMGSVMRAKKSAEFNLYFELETAALERFEKIVSYEFECDNVIEFFNTCGLSHIESMLQSDEQQEDQLIYCDPPYLLDTRTSNTRYKNEFTKEDHERFLNAVTQLNCMVMISHYPCDLYNDALKGWRKVPYKSVTRSGEQREEILYCNFAQPTFLHDSQYLGKDRRQREDIKRRITRNVRKLSETECNERLRILTEMWDHLTDYEREQITKIGKNSGYGQEQI